MTVNTPPVLSGGWPVLGHALEMMRNRESLFKRGFQEHGDVFAIKLGPRYAAVVSGAENNKLFYTQTDKTLNMQDAYQFLKASLGEVLFTASKEAYYNQRPALQEVFRRERMVDYIRAMNIEIQHWIDGLGDAGEMDFSAEMLRLAQFVAGHALIGPKYQKELGAGFWDLYLNISRSLDPILPPSLPIPKFRRRDKAKAAINHIFSGMIEERRQLPDQYDDLISTLLRTPLKDGSVMDDQTIINMFTGLLFAGHETTAGQAAWTVAQLLQHSDYLGLVMAELNMKLKPDSDLNQESINQLDHIAWAIEETTRMYPSADLQMRTVEQPLDLGGYHLPVGWQVIVNAANSHYLPEVFKDPYVYDPLRWSPERGEGKNPFTLVGFGGGIHKCTGMNFAKNEMIIIIVKLLQTFELELLSQEIRVVQGAGANHPSEIKIRYKKR
ncbi:MAG: cytochrome P450 [Anaerolineaceae bacterium]|nr:cytochrome P450 [Anaerolineaceae bacterium]